MQWIDIYIQEVVRRLPEASRKDIALELRSTIEDMLPEDYDEEDIKAVLQKLGNPAVLASRYRDQPMHLIGPRYYEAYVSLLKMLLPIAAVIALISMTVESVAEYSNTLTASDIISNLFTTGIGTMLEVGIHVFFWLTLIFAILDRTDKERDGLPVTSKFTQWTPDDLKEVTYAPKKKRIAKLEVFGSLLWIAIWASLYFYANQWLGVYEKGTDGLNFVTTPLNQDVLIQYWPLVVIVIGLEIALALYKLMKGIWTKSVAISNAIVECMGTLVFIVIFLNPMILTPEFVAYMSDLFTSTADQFKGWAINGVIIISIISTVISIYEGFRKAMIRN